MNRVETTALVCRALAALAPHEKSRLLGLLSSADDDDAASRHLAVKQVFAATGVSHEVFASAFGYKRSVLIDYLEDKKGTFGAVSRLRAMLSVGDEAATAPAWASQWLAFFAEFQISSDFAQTRLRALADTPAELAFLPRCELLSLGSQGVLKRSTVERLRVLLDDWLVVARVAGVPPEQLVALRSLALFPSELAQSDRCLLRTIGLKLTTLHLVEVLCGALGGWDRQPNPRDDDSDDAEEDAGEIPDSFLELFCGIVAEIGTKTVRAPGLVDELVARVSGERHVGQLLDQMCDKDTVKVLELCGGWFTDLSPLVARLGQFGKLSLLDLSTTRVAASEFERVKIIAAAMATRNGAVVVTNTPVSSSATATQWAAWAAEASTNEAALASFLHVIWIPRGRVNGRSWLSRLGQSAAALERAVAMAHHAFFSATQTHERMNDE